MRKFAQKANDAGRHLAAASSVVLLRVGATLLFHDGRMCNLQLSEHQNTIFHSTYGIRRSHPLNVPPLAMVGNFGAKPACYHRLLGMLATRYRILYLEGGNAKDLPDYATINSVSLDSQRLRRKPACRRRCRRCNDSPH